MSCPSLSAVHGFGLSGVVAPRPVSHRDLWLFWPTSEFQSSHESSGGRRSVRMFTLCSNPALQPRDIFPPVVTHGERESLPNTHKQSCDDHVLVDIQDILNVSVLKAKFIVGTAVAAIMMHGGTITLVIKLKEIIHWWMTSCHLILHSEQSVTPKKCYCIKKGWMKYTQASPLNFCELKLLFVCFCSQR